MTKRLLKTLSVLPLLMVLVGGTAQSATYEFQLNSTDLYNAFGDPGIDHNYYYEWGINQTFSNEIITSATLSFTNLRNWAVEPNWMYVYLENWVPPGVYPTAAQKGDGSPFDSLLPQSDYTYVETLNNLPTTGQDIVIDFGALSGGRSVIDQFNVLALDGNFGIGFDPHCHYWFDTISLQVTTKPVPEPGTLVLLGSGLVGIASWGRKRLRNR